MIRRLAVLIAAWLAGTAQAQQWVQLTDPLAFDKPPPIWCNADRSACIVSRQPFGADGAVRVALTVPGTPDCRQRRTRYVYVKSSGERDGDLTRAPELLGNTCLFNIPINQIEGTRLLRFSVPMLTQNSVVMELSLEGLDVNRLAPGRL